MCVCVCIGVCTPCVGGCTRRVYVGCVCCVGVCTTCVCVVYGGDVCRKCARHVCVCVWGGCARRVCVYCVCVGGMCVWGVVHTVRV